MTTLEGVYPPVPAPFRGGAVAHDRLATNLARLSAHPFGGYAVPGPTGELPLLTDGGKERVVATAREHTPGGRRPVAGTRRDSTDACVHPTRWAAQPGADGAIVVIPSSFKAALHLMGGCVGSPRSPLPAPDADGVAEIREALATAGGAVTDAGGRSTTGDIKGAGDRR